MDRSLPFRFLVVTAFRSDRGPVVAGRVEQGDVVMGAVLAAEHGGARSVLRGLSGLRQPGQPALVALELPDLDPADVVEGDVLVVAP